MASTKQILQANAARSHQNGLLLVFLQDINFFFARGGKGGACGWSIFTMKSYTNTPVSFPMFVHPHVTQEMLNRFSEKSNIGKVY